MTKVQDAIKTKRAPLDAKASYNLVEGQPSLQD